MTMTLQQTPRPTDAARSGRRVRRRRVVAGAALAVVALLLANTLAVSRQGAAGTGGSLMTVDGEGVDVLQDGPHDAPAVVLIHGLAGSAHWWDPLVPRLEGEHRVIRVDLLGHGRSAKPAGGGYAISDQAARVAGVLDQLGVRDAVVVGHSTGGSVATALAEQRGDLVAGLALVDSGPRIDAFVSEGVAGRLLLTPVVGQALWRLRTDAIVRRSMSTAVSSPGYEFPHQLVDDVRGMTYHALTATSRAADDYLEEQPLPDRLSGLDTPLLVLFGKADRRWQPSSAEDYRAVPGARIEMLADVGHSPMLEDPPRTADLLLGFAAATTSGR
jgi:pimeloyl-ACP methyl ester carboxylesterase